MSWPACLVVPSDGTTLINTVLGSSATLIGVTITIVTLAPALVEIARSRSQDYIAGERSRAVLKFCLRGLIGNVIILAAALIVSLLFLIHHSDTLFWLAAGALILGLLVLAVLGLFAAMVVLGKL
jgi:hypothetical protein